MIKKEIKRENFGPALWPFVDEIIGLRERVAALEAAARPTSDNERPTMYGIGEREGDSFAMWDGPNPDLSQMLSTFGESADSCIIKLNADGTEEVLYEWRDGIRWQKVGIEESTK